MDLRPWSPTHLLRWTPTRGAVRTWPVRVIRTEVASQPWWLAQSLEDHRVTRAPDWEYEAAADRWTWRGLGGYEGAAGTVRCESLDGVVRGASDSSALQRGRQS